MDYRAIFATFIVLVISGCSNNSIYRSSFSQECEYQQIGDCAAITKQIANKGAENEYRLGFIEYDDQGQLRDRAQQDSVIDHYYSLAGQQEVIVITFVHGWHHSAKPEDTNIQEFRKLLCSISAKESDYSKRFNRKKRLVLGVYTGWRGDSIDIEYVNAINNMATQDCWRNSDRFTTL